MKIVHIQLRGPYTDNWGYQENILPRCQARLGDDVYLITQNKKHLGDGTIVKTEETRYVLDDGVKVIRIDTHSVLFSYKIGSFLGNYKYLKLLDEIKPDMVFVHGLFTGMISSRQISTYKKENPDCIVVSDSHEYGFGIDNIDSLKERIKRLLKRRIINNIISTYDNIYCLSPICKSFCNNYYGIPEKNIEILPLGYDDNLCDINNKYIVRENLRRKYNIGDDDILLIHGGKIIPRRLTEIAIDTAKVLHSANNKVKLVVFGDIAEEIRGKIEKKLKECDNFVYYLGHQKQEDYIDWFLASDIAIFPGAPSALWQEAIGCELLLALSSGFDSEYLNIANNVIFCKPGDINDFCLKIKNAIDNNTYMSNINPGLQSARKYFSYCEMANKLRTLVLCK